PPPPPPSPTQAAPAPSTPPPSGSRIKASPLAKKIAAQSQVDLARISGTGPGGRIVARDVRNVQTAGSVNAATAAVPVTAGPPPTPVPTDIPHSQIELTGMRRTIASRLLESKTRIPHFYIQIEVDAGKLVQVRKQLNEIAETTGGPKITINDFILFATARAAVAQPKVNAAFTEKAIIQYNSVNLAVAVAIEDGLVTPVIRDAQHLSLSQMSAAVKDLAGRARNKKLKPDEYQGGTLTVSNLGAYGIENFFAIINPPQSVILGVGALVKKPVVNAQDQIVVGHRMAISLSCDHRVVDGAVGAEFLGTIRKFLETPESLLF
ncbi:MAG: dihydrolipoamide acetyltransferase, partial [Verrucomicrobia bacterium]